MDVFVVNFKNNKLSYSQAFILSCNKMIKGSQLAPLSRFSKILHNVTHQHIHIQCLYILWYSNILTYTPMYK